VLAACFIRTVMLKFVLSATLKEKIKINESINFLIKLVCSLITNNKLRFFISNLFSFLKRK
jgi:hypothetical protein